MKPLVADMVQADPAKAAKRPPWSVMKQSVQSSRWKFRSPVVKKKKNS
jgi:hypothetical protein